MTKRTTPAVRIAATRPNFRRAGMAHSTDPVIHPAGTLRNVTGKTRPSESRYKST